MFALFAPMFALFALFATVCTTCACSAKTINPKKQVTLCNRLIDVCAIGECLTQNKINMAEFKLYATLKGQSKRNIQKYANCQHDHRTLS